MAIGDGCAAKGGKNSLHSACPVFSGRKGNFINSQNGADNSGCGLMLLYAIVSV